MKDLIKVETNEKLEQIIKARELYEFLEIKERFNSWFERMLQYGFVENEDFTSVKSFTLVNNGAKREIQDYSLKIETAKEMCMLARNEKGKQARKYFIEIEKAWNTPELIMARALQVAEKQIIEYKKQIEENKPKVDFANKLLSSKKNILVREYAKILREEGIMLGEKKLYKWLRENKYLMKNNEPYERYMKYFYLKENVIESALKTIVRNTTMITPEGQIYFYSKLKN